MSEGFAGKFSHYSQARFFPWDLLPGRCSSFIKTMRGEGAICYLTKPFDGDSLIQGLQAALKKHDGGGGK